MCVCALSLTCDPSVVLTDLIQISAHSVTDEEDDFSLAIASSSPPTMGHLPTRTKASDANRRMRMHSDGQHYNRCVSVTLQNTTWTVITTSIHCHKQQLSFMCTRDASTRAPQSIARPKVPQLEYDTHEEVKRTERMNEEACTKQEAPRSFGCAYTRIYAYISSVSSDR